MKVLPSRPLRLHRRFTLGAIAAAVLLGLGGAAICIAYTAWQVDEARAILREQAIWATGTDAVAVEVGGTARSHYGVFHDYDLRVRYVDQHGAEHDRAATFSSLFGSASEEREPLVRYDPASPDRFALSWAHEVTVARWTSFVFMLLAGNLIGVVVGLLGVLASSRLRSMRRCLASPVELECELVSSGPQILDGKATGNIEYRYVLPDLPTPDATASGHYREPSDPRPRTPNVLSTAMKHGVEPFFMDRAKTRILVLVSPQERAHPIVLEHDLYPLAVTHDERVDAQARVEAREVARDAPFA